MSEESFTASIFTSTFSFFRNEKWTALETKQINTTLVFKLHCLRRSGSFYFYLQMIPSLAPYSFHNLNLSITFISSSAHLLLFFSFHVHPHRAQSFSSVTSRILIECSCVCVCVLHTSSQARMECIINFSRGAVFPAASSSPTIRFAKSVFDRRG